MEAFLTLLLFVTSLMAMGDFDTITFEIFLVILGIGVASILGWLSNSIKKRLTHHENLQKDVADVKKSIWRLSKTLIIMAKIIDDQTAKNHPELTASLEDIAEELLKSNGNYEGRPSI